MHAVSPLPVQEKLQKCRRCPRLQKQFRALRKTHPDYWNLPVSATGPDDALILVVGLAPGMHGANRTGIPFTGDASGDLLHATLDEVGIRAQVRVTNALKCLPPQNKPTADELTRCRPKLKAELRLHQQGSRSVILALGRVAHNSILAALGRKQSEFPFSHGACHELVSGHFLVDSYHCSRYNTQTRRLTPEMFRDVVGTALRLTEAAPS